MTPGACFRRTLSDVLPDSCQIMAGENPCLMLVLDPAQRPEFDKKDLATLAKNGKWERCQLEINSASEPDDEILKGKPVKEHTPWQDQEKPLGENKILSVTYPAGSVWGEPAASDSTSNIVEIVSHSRTTISFAEVYLAPHLQHGQHPVRLPTWHEVSNLQPSVDYLERPPEQVREVVRASMRDSHGNPKSDVPIYAKVKKRHVVTIPKPLLTVKDSNFDSAYCPSR